MRDVNMKAILTEQQLTVLRLRYRDDMTQAEIAAELRICQKTVSNILARAFERLKQEKNVILDMSY